MALLGLPCIRVTLLLHRVYWAPALRELPVVHLAARLLRLYGTKPSRPDNTLRRWCADGAAGLLRALPVILDDRVVVVLQVRVVRVQLVEPLLVLGGFDLPLLRLARFRLALAEQVQFWAAEWIPFLAGGQRPASTAILATLFVLVRRRPVPLAQVHLLVLVLSRARASVVDYHVGCESTDVGVVGEL